MPEPTPMSNFDRYVQAKTDGAKLGRQSLKSGLITFAAQPIKLVMGIGATAILARLVTPADFGLLAMVAPLLLLVDSLSNFGLETATVQQQDLTHQQASDAFWLSLKINVIIIAIMVAMGPVLSWFYQQQALVGITAVMAIGAFSLCLSFQHKALLKRQMKFKLLAAIELVSIALSTLCAIAAAWLGLGYWALVLQVVVLQVVEGIACWITCKWRPSLPASTKADRHSLTPKQPADSIRSMFSYSAHLTGFRFITRIGMQMDRILVGYISGAAALGFYDVAYRWAYFPFIQIYAPLFDVAVSSLSRAYENPKTYRKYARWSLMALFALCFPALAFLYITAKDILLFLLGEQWLSAIPIFRLLLIAISVGSMYRVTKWLYLSSGQTQRQLRWGFIHTPITIIAVAIGAQWGAYGIAAGYTIGTCVLTLPSIVFCLRDSPLTIADFFSTVWPAATSAILAAIALLVATPALSNLTANSLLLLCLEATCFAIVYCTIWLLLPSGKQSIAQIVLNLNQRSQRL